MNSRTTHIVLPAVFSVTGLATKLGHVRLPSSAQQLTADFLILFQCRVLGGKDSGGEDCTVGLGSDTPVCCGDGASPVARQAAKG